MSAFHFAYLFFVYNSIFLLFSLLNSITMCVYIFKYFIVDEHFGCFQVLTNIAASLNISFATLVSFLLSAVVPLIHGKTLQDSQWMPETSDNTEVTNRRGAYTVWYAGQGGDSPPRQDGARLLRVSSCYSEWCTI